MPLSCLEKAPSRTHVCARFFGAGFSFSIDSSHPRKGGKGGGRHSLLAAAHMPWMDFLFFHPIHVAVSVGPTTILTIHQLLRKFSDRFGGEAVSFVRRPTATSCCVALPPAADGLFAEVKPPPPLKTGCACGRSYFGAFCQGMLGL